MTIKMKIEISIGIFTPTNTHKSKTNFDPFSCVKLELILE